MGITKAVLNNKKARHDYHIIEDLQAGLQLLGTEIKSLREGRGSLKGSFCRFSEEEIFVHGMHIHEYSKGNINNHDPLRIRKILIRKREIKKWLGKIQEKGYTIVPLSLFFVRGYAKLNIALVKGKNLYDKRDSLKQKTMKREVARSLKNYNTN